MRGILNLEELPLTVNPLMARKAAAQRGAMLRPDVTDIFDYGPDWRSYGQNFLRNLAENFPAPGATDAESISKIIGLTGLGIISPKTARLLNTPRALPDNSRFLSAVSNTPGARITDEGLLLPVKRWQKAEQEGSPSVRGGVFYLPEHSGYARAYNSDIGNYGGQQKISGQTLIANPLAVYGSTGGGVPERAFKNLLGPGAASDLYDDVRFAQNGSLGNVEDFLKAYAPEMKDYADYIAWSSRRSNQLRYALQEAAIGSAARKAGHDAIVGYSHGYGKPLRLSEVFDLRERNYPSPRNQESFSPSSYIWPQFLKPE